MPMLALLSVLLRMKLLTPAGLYRLLFVICRYGINLMALLKLAASSHGDRIALTDDRETLSYKQLLDQSERLTVQLREHYGLGSRSKVGMLCRNHASLVKSIFAASMTGADIYLMNADMSTDQFNRLMDDHSFDLLIIEEELTTFVEQSSYTGASVRSYHDRLPAISNLIYASTDGQSKPKRKWPRTSTGKLMLLTGGTTGRAKKVAHKPSLFRYLPPFSSMLTKLRLLHYSTVYIATPIYHGYGVAVLLLFVALGKKSVITAVFHAEKACRLITEHQVEVVTVVPLMVDKMLRERAGDLKSLACIASGGAELSPRLASEVSSKLGDVLFNLYGTSESGLNIIATPQDLKYSSNTIGQLIKGVRLKVLDSNMREVGAGEIGQFCVRRNRSVWIKTGDMGYRDERGYYFLKGRVDDMIVSAGENVYPSELEQILFQHPLIVDAAVVGIRDEQFGQRLKAVVQLMPGVELTAEALTEWLRGRAARYQMPKEIVFVEQLAHTPLGKRDKKHLG
ncbi:AMP-binding protein [Paenibacillus harenae]|uniref:AMP-binding protein n=1 Tax=Paenibacillus harenae TaxID=306543 RepID=UPI0027943C61|nr:AMP-binding protein [Paenibacillus harenae]MDQ0058687.1 acyl-CoA synthetase (AMP-forming)/AMP-acid ligase II [Paenibacillus harenae]